MTKLVHLYASQRVSRRAKDGSDGTSVTILSTKVLYQVSASPTDIPTTWYDDIKNAIQTDSKPYLWSKTIVAYSGNKTTITYSVSYKGKDGTNGTSFTPKGMADGYYRKATEIPAYSDEQNGKIYLVDDATNVTSPFIVPDAPYVVQYVLHNGEYVLFLVHAEFGDGYNVNGHLYVANDDKWVDFGEIQGAKGDQGDPGIDAVNINLSPSELVYNADKDGYISSTQFNNNTSKVSATRGGKDVSCTVSIMSKDNCEARIISSNDIKITKITTESVATGKYVPASAGGVKLKVTVDGTDYYSYLPFRVNTNTFVKTVLETDESFQRKYTEISNKYNTISNELNGKASKDELMEVSSSIEQTARRISLEVSSNAVGRRNLLVNSDFHNQESLHFSSGTRIECTTGKDGINCVHITSSSENGVYWDGTKSGGMSVVITKGKKYTFSCWVKSSSTSAQFRIRAYSTSDIANASSKTDFYETVWMNVSSPNTWEQFRFTIDTSSAVTNYLAVIFCVTSASDAYICQPMMEEGDTYKGWSRSQQDYDYVGGNMIDNARTLEVGGSLKSLNPNGLPDYERSYYGDSMSIRIKNTNANNTYLVMEFATDSMELDVDYIFSFLAKGKANIGFYAQCDINAEGDSVFSEDSVNQGTRLLNFRYASIIEIPNQLTTQYKRYWGHMRFHGHLPSKLYIQLNGDGEVYVCQPKLEKGATMTEFTERKTDLVDKASLKKAGIEITTNQVKLYGDKVQVLTRKDENSEYVEAGMFVNGKLNANLIDAQTINVNHVYARSSEGASVIGHFGNFDRDDAVVGNDKCPLWLGAALAKDAPFRVTKDGSLYASKGIFAGELQGVTGSFHRLTAVSSDGNKSAGSIYFDGSGRITFDADIYNQGYNYAKNRGWRFYASSVWCRSAFGHQQSTLAVINGGSMRVYPDGYDSGYTVKALEHTTYDNKTVYKIPLYSPNDESAGCPIDVVVFCSDRAIATNYYEFVPGGTGKRWMAINANDRNSDVYFCDVGGWHQLYGGETINLVYIHPELLSPSQNDKTYFGRGIFWSGETDLNWKDRKS